MSDNPTIRLSKCEQTLCALQELRRQDAATITRLTAERDEARARAEQAKNDGWSAGYLIAISTMLGQHGEDVIAEDALMATDLKLADAKRLDLCDYDLKLLAPVFANMRRKEKLRREKAAALAAKGAGDGQ